MSKARQLAAKAPAILANNPATKKCGRRDCQCQQERSRHPRGFPCPAQHRAHCERQKPTEQGGQQSPCRCRSRQPLQCHPLHEGTRSNSSSMPCDMEQRHSHQFYLPFGGEHHAVGAVTCWGQSSRAGIGLARSNKKKKKSPSARLGSPTRMLLHPEIQGKVGL